MTRENAKKEFPVWNGLSNCLWRGLSNLICPNGCMTSTRSPLTLLCDYVAHLSRTAEGDLALKRFARAGMEVDLADDLTMLLRRRGSGVIRIRRVELVEFLIALAPSDEVAALCTVVSLRPELGWMTRRSTRDPVGPDEAEADVVAVAWEVVTKRHDCRSGPLRQPALVNGIWTAVRRSAGLRRRVLLDVVPLPDDFDQAVLEVDRLERWPGILAAAVARGVLTPRQVALIAQTRMEQRPLSEVAIALGRPYDAVRKERRRAEAALRQFALGYFTSEEE
jgi:DNA-directed RNA polymerase specialized sigma24 family protein